MKYRAVIIALLIGVSCLVLYAITLPGNHSESEDGFNYAWQVENISWRDSLHPHHLLYVPLIKTLRHAVISAGVTIRAYPIMVGISMLAGAFTIAISFLIFRCRLGFSCLVSAFSSGLIAVSYGFWRYACEAEIYIPVLAPLILSTFLLTKSRATPLRVMASALIVSCATLIHIFAAIPALLAFPVLITGPRARILRLLYVMQTVVVVLAIYMATGMLSRDATPTTTLSSLIHVTREHAHPSTILHAAVGFGQTVLSGNFLFAVAPFRTRIPEMFPDRMLQEEVMMGRHAGLTAAVLPGITLVLLTILGIFMITQRWPRRSTSDADAEHHLPAPFGSIRQTLTRAMIIWFAGHMILLSLYEPANPEGWIVALIPFWFMLLLLWTGKRTAVPHRPLGALLILVLLHNYVGGMALIANAESDYNQAKSAWLIKHAQAGDTILTAGNPVFYRYLRYHTPATVIDIQSSSLARVRTILRDAPHRKNQIFITDDLFTPPDYLHITSPAAQEVLTVAAREAATHCKKIHTDMFGGIWSYQEW